MTTLLKTAVNLSDLDQSSPLASGDTIRLSMLQMPPPSNDPGVQVKTDMYNEVLQFLRSVVPTTCPSRHCLLSVIQAPSFPGVSPAWLRPLGTGHPTCQYPSLTLSHLHDEQTHVGVSRLAVTDISWVSLHGYDANHTLKAGKGVAAAVSKPTGSRRSCAAAAAVAAAATRCWKVQVAG